MASDARLGGPSIPSISPTIDFYIDIFAQRLARTSLHYGGLICDVLGLRVEEVQQLYIGAAGISATLLLAFLLLVFLSRRIFSPFSSSSASPVETPETANKGFRSEAPSKSQTKGKQREKNSSSSKTASNSAPSSHLASLLAQGVRVHTAATHSQLLGTLKGHTGVICSLDVAANNKYLISASEDRLCLLWSLKELGGKEHKTLRIPINLDHASVVRFSPDTRAFVAALANENLLRVFRFGRPTSATTLPPITPAFDFPRLHSEEILNVSVASTGKYIMIAYRDTKVHICDLKGTLLASIDTQQGQHTHATLSPCARFLAVSGFTSEVRVWEVLFSTPSTRPFAGVRQRIVAAGGGAGDVGGGDDAEGVVDVTQPQELANFKELRKAFTLGGKEAHRGGVQAFDFSDDSTKMVTAAKDGTWKVWDINVAYQQQQEPRVLYTGKHPFAQATYCRAAFAPDSTVFALSADSELALYDALSPLPSGAQLPSAAPAAPTEPEQSDYITFPQSIGALQWDMRSKALCVASGRQIFTFSNALGLKVMVRTLSARLAAGQLSRDIRERVEEQRRAAEAELQALLNARSAAVSGSEGVTNAALAAAGSNGQSTNRATASGASGAAQLDLDAASN